MGWKTGSWIVLFLAAMLVFPAVTSAAGAVPRISREKLKSLLGDPGVVILDVRLGGEDATERIPGAVYEDPAKVDSWEKRYDRRKTIVLYCS